MILREVLIKISSEFQKERLKTVVPKKPAKIPQGKIKKRQTEQQLLLTILLVRRKSLSRGTMEDFIHRDFLFYGSPIKLCTNFFDYLLC